MNWERKIFKILGIIEMQFSNGTNRFIGFSSGATYVSEKKLMAPEPLVSFH